MSIDEQIAKFVKEYGFTIPDRGLQEANDPNFAWRERKPDYRKADLLFFQGKSKNHLPGSLEFKNFPSPSPQHTILFNKGKIS